MVSNADVYIAAKRGLVEYRSIFLPSPDDVSPAGFHYEWSKELLRGDGHVAFEGFRESAKSSIILRAFPLYALTFPSERWNYIVVLKANMAQARKVLKGISNEYLGNKFINGRLLKVLKNTSDVFEVLVDNNGEKMNILIEAYGKGASIRGLSNKDVRPSLIIGDDLQDSSDLLGENVPENDWDWFLGDVMFLGQSARIFLIGNNLGERCIIERVGKNADNLGFKFKRIPCADDAMTKSAWPEKQSIEEIIQERKDYEAVGKLDVWLREKMCVAVSDETRLFNDTMYRYYPSSLRDRLASEGEVLASLDPASSKRTDSCFRSITVGALMPDGHWYLLDNPYGRWDSVELMDRIFGCVRKWGIRDFGVEKGQYQQFLEPVLYREMTLRKCRFNVTPLEHGKLGSKLERIKMLQPYFKSGAVWFPEGAEWLTEMRNELAGVTRDELKSEFVDLCFAKGTKVATEFGDKNIEDILVGDTVITPFGYRRVTASKCTGDSEVIEKFGLRATKDHRIYVNNIGFASIGDLCDNASINKLTFMEVLSWRLRKLFCSMEGVIISGQREDIILTQEWSKEKSLTTRYIGISGNFIIRKEYQRAITFIISTATVLITTLTTLNVYHLSNIIKYPRRLIKIGIESILNQLDRWHQNGIRVIVEDYGTNSMLRIKSLAGRYFRGLVMFVAERMNINLLHPSIAQTGVLKLVPEEEMELGENARYVVKKYSPSHQGSGRYVASLVTINSRRNIIQKLLSVLFAGKKKYSVSDLSGSHVQGCVLKNSQIKEPVFNITVEKEGVYYANGVLVSNCDSLAMLVCQLRAFTARTEQRREKYNTKREPEYKFNPMTV